VVLVQIAGLLNLPDGPPPPHRAVGSRPHRPRRRGFARPPHPVASPLPRRLRLVRLDASAQRRSQHRIAQAGVPCQRPADPASAQHTGQPVEAIERDTDRDNFMSAEEAMRYGLVDKVLTSRADVA
jgi:hypothetical protein